MIYVLMNLLALPSREADVAPVETGHSPRIIAEHLAEAITFRTISGDDPASTESSEFIRLHAFLRQAYPRLHAALEREVVNGLSLLFTWEGQNRLLEPILLLAHQDVVPAEDAAAWKYPPFAGRIAEQAVWGRGAVDVKGALIAICEAVEGLVARGFRPRRTIHLAFGHDEEVGGLNGAAAIGDLLERRGTRPLFISDEGGAILHGVIPGVKKPVAAIGIGEKGYLTLELKVTMTGGHTSMPPAHTAIGILSDAIQRLESRPFPATLSTAARQMLRALAREMPWTARIAIAGLPLLAPIIKRRLEKTPSGAATLRTTTAVTMIESGIKDNVLPHEAVATLNCRVLPGEDSLSVIRRIRDVIDDPRVQISIAGRFHSEPPPVARVDTPGYQLIKRTIAELAPDAVVAPCLVLGGTDSRHYTRLTPSVYRFGALRITAEDLASIHGKNEKISLDNCQLLVRFYTRLIQNSAE
jgi:carboxypeptidase PM20D1